MVSLYAQNIGISNDNTFTTPQSPLHIYWTSDGNLLQLSRSSAANTGLTFSVSNNDYSILNRQNNALIFGTNATERMRITNTGNVGIGTNSPAAQLHTTGTVRFAGYPSGANGAILRTNSSGDLSITNFSGAANDVLLGTGAFGSMNSLAWQLTGNSGLTDGTNNFLGTTSAVPLKFVTNGTANVRMTIAAAGTIGVNVAPSTSYQLYASSALAVAGNATIYGESTGSAQVYGVLGTASGNVTNASGVRGYASGATAATNGVWGEAASSLGSGVYGLATHANGDGVFGFNSAAAGAGTGAGVYGISRQTGAAGVVGDGSTSTRGVLGMNNNDTYAAVQAQNANAGGDALLAYNTAANGSGIGTAIWAYSGQTGASTIVAGLRSWNYFANAAISGITDATISNGIGIIGACNNASGVGVQGQSAGTGVFGTSSSAIGMGILGLNTAAASASAGFAGFFRSEQRGGAVLAASLANSSTYLGGSAISAYVANYNASTQAIYAFNDYSTAAVNPIWAVRAYTTNSLSNDGNGYGQASNNSGGIRAFNFNGATYTFGVAGWNYNDDNRCAGTFGGRYDANYWGALGYKASNNTAHGVYGSTAYASGGGKSSNIVFNGTGVAGYGSLFGATFRGQIYGMVVKGERYAIYSDGAQYTNNIISQLNDIPNSSSRIPTYVPTSTTVDIISRGIAQIINGNTTITFPKEFKDLVSETEPVIVTVTPMGRPAQLYIQNTTKSNFTIVDATPNADKSQPLTVSWIAIGVRKGYENPQVPNELLSKDFDRHLDEFLFNDADTTRNGKPMWWDGQTLRFDNIPEEKIEKTDASDRKFLKTIPEDSLPKFIESKKLEKHKVVVDSEKLGKKSTENNNNIQK